MPRLSKNNRLYRMTDDDIASQAVTDGGWVVYRLVAAATFLGVQRWWHQDGGRMGGQARDRAIDCAGRRFDMSCRFLVSACLAWPLFPSVGCLLLTIWHTQLVECSSWCFEINFQYWHKFLSHEGDPYPTLRLSTFNPANAWPFGGPHSWCLDLSSVTRALCRIVRRRHGSKQGKQGQTCLGQPASLSELPHRAVYSRRTHVVPLCEKRG